MARINRNYFLIGFLFGIASGAFWPSMPTLIWLMPIVVLFFVLCCTKCGYLSKGLILGCCIALIQGNHYRFVTETLFSQGDEITMEAKVVSLVHPAIHGQQTILSIQRIGDVTLPWYCRPTVKAFFNGQSQPLPELGDVWQFSALIKPVAGLLNDAGFDSEQYYVSNLWHGKALIELDDKMNFRVKSSHSWRSHLHKNLLNYIADLQSKPFILALAFGDRSELSDQQWQQLRDSGLSHLMAISGLHIGLAMAIGWYLGRVMKSTLTFLFPTQSLVRFLPCVISFVVAYFYAYLAGFSLPTQRALIMGCIVLLALGLRIHWSVWQVLLYSLCTIVVLQPFALLQPSFWLSFSAIIVIYLSLWFVATPHQQRRKSFWKVITIQIGLFFGLMFLTVLFFGGISWVSPLVNLAAIPWVSIAVVPMIFFGLILTPFNSSVLGFYWEIVDAALYPILWILRLVDGFWIALSWQWGVVFFTLCFALMACRFKYYLLVYTIIVATLVLLFFPAKPRPDWQVQILDVGQGLAVLIRKNQQSVLYDTGISWQNGSMAQSIVIPLLAKDGEHQLEGLIISHTDADHAGGREDIESKLTPKWMRSSESIPGYQPCIKGQSWQWLGLSFDALWPPKQVQRAYNPHSCVIKVSDGQFNLLLTGDIDAISEILMLRDFDSDSIDVMTVPHHGSATSSFPSFVKTLQPSVAVASLGVNNQWGLPNPSVKARYQKMGTKWVDTGTGGQVTISIYANNWFIEQKRQNQYQPWYRQIVRKGLE